MHFRYPLSPCCIETEQPIKIKKTKHEELMKNTPKYCTFHFINSSELQQIPIRNYLPSYSAKETDSLS